MRIEPEIDGANIVLLGNFNPSILTPAWFVNCGLLPEGVETTAKLHVAHSEVTAFDAEWLELRVQQDSFLAGTTKAPHTRICDLVLELFGKHLAHTPVKALGINRTVHFRVGGMQARDRVGRTLAPTTVWGEWCAALEPGGEHGGMTSLTMTQVSVEGRAKGGRISVTVEPSRRIGDGIDGIYVAVNDHYVIVDGSAQPGEHIVNLLSDNFEKSVRHSETLIDHVMSLARGTQEG
ncbi:MAG: hypothetical protein OXI83_06015 [Gemmatimonadota bacterium]|nr:hypothetical protein [Gemmatimonadota bacterium]